MKLNNTQLIILSEETRQAFEKIKENNLFNALKYQEDFKNSLLNIQKELKNYPLGFFPDMKKVGELLEARLLYYHEHNSAITKQENSLNVKGVIYRSRIEGVNNCFKNFEILSKRMELRKEIKYDDNVVMVHDFICYLNDLFLYLNNSLINLKIKDASHTEEFFGVDAKNKNGGRDSYHNNLKNFLKWINNLNLTEAEKTNMHKLKTFFSLYENVIRNFYSHGWLDIFKLLALDTDTQDSALFYLSYEIDKNKLIKRINNGKEEEIENKNFDQASLKIVIWEAEEFLNDINSLQQEKLENIEIMRKYKISTPSVEEIILSQEMARPFLRTVSTNPKYQNIVPSNYPDKIRIFSTAPEYPNVEISEESFFEYAKILILIIESLVEKKIINTD